MINYQHQKGAQYNFLDVSTGMEREKAGRLVKSLARLYIKTWSQDRHWVLRRYFRLVLPQWHQNLVFLGLSTMKWNSWLLLLPFPYHCRVATMLEWWAIICIRCISLRLVWQIENHPGKKETKQSFPFMIHFYLCFSFIRMCCISKPLGRYVTRPTCEKLHALISHIWVAFFAPSCTRALILLSICTDNTPPYRHNGVFARDVCVLRIHSQGSVMCARVLPLRMEGEKPVVRRHGHMHLV